MNQSLNNQKKVINLNKACRICLSEKIHLRELFRTRIPKMIESFSSIQISENDGMPCKICATCFHLATKLYNFKKKMERNDSILRQYVENLGKISKRDIINIALSEADIKDVSSTEEIIKTENELQIDDISFHERLKFPEENSNISQSIHKTQLNLNLNDKQNVQIFSGGPPPLVPLEPLKRTDILKEPLESRVEDLPKDTPLLVPIKPLMNIKALENIVPKNEDIKYQCNNCTDEFTSFLALKDHKLNTCQPNALQCNVCRREFKETKKLIGHLKGHMVVKDYACKICGKCYPNPSTFTVHMRSHTGERPFRCQICNKGFVRWAGVMGHMKTHEEAKPYKCATCGKAFKISSNLERHKILHSGILPYCCSYCGKCFSQSDNLQLHIRTYHTNERPFLCSECGKGFVSSTRLNRHMWVHSGYKPYSCRICSKAYTNSNDLKNHERQHLGKKAEDFKNYSCEVCGKRFYHPCRLARHLKVHDKIFKCHVCNKPFSSTVLLSEHVKNKHGLSYVDESIFQQDGTVADIYVEYQKETAEVKIESDIQSEKFGSVVYDIKNLK